MYEDYMFEDEDIEPKKAQFTYEHEPEKPPAPQQSIGLAVTAFVLGIISLVLFLSFINVILALAAIIIGIIFIATAKEKRGKGLALTGLLTGIASIVIFVVCLSIMWMKLLPYEDEILKAYGFDSYEINYQIEYGNGSYDGDHEIDDNNNELDNYLNDLDVDDTL